MSDHLSQSTCLEMLHPKTDDRVNPIVEVHHLVWKLSAAETLMRCNIFYLIILFNLIIPTLLSLVGGPLSGNGCGSPNHL